MQAMASTLLVCIACSGNATLPLKVQECQGSGFAVKGVATIRRCFERVSVAEVEWESYSGRVSGTSNYCPLLLYPGCTAAQYSFHVQMPSALLQANPKP